MSIMTFILVWERKKEKKKLGRALAMMERVVSICSAIWGDGDTDQHSSNSGAETTFLPRVNSTYDHHL
ncbi:hypothetical protein ACHAXH_001001 [Discostella pseudostelligera]